MNGALPSIPDTTPPPGLWVPLARWWKPNETIGYLLLVMLDPEVDDGAPYKHDIDTFTRDEAGMWHWSGGGGSDWRFGWNPRPHGSALVFEGSGSGSGPTVAPGVAGADVSAVVVKAATWSAECQPEARTGAFLIAANLDELVEITALDAVRQPVNALSDTTIWDVLQLRHWTRC